MAIAFVEICLFIVILNNALGSGGEFDFMLPFKNEDIICGTPTLLNPAPIKISSTGNSLYGLIFYIKNNFGQFARLAWLKTVAFFGLYRSYFSSWHNIYLISLFYPLYIMAIASLSYWRKSDRKIFIYLLSSILVVWLTVMLTCDDWHNRFYLGISPYIIIASLGLIKKISAK